MGTPDLASVLLLVPKFFMTCLCGLIWNSGLLEGDLDIFGDGEVAIVGDLLYGIWFCGIPCRRANVEYDGLVIELYVHGYGVEAMNLF
nr:hypothetical protein [Tanacetum cinerariifolium]